MEKIKVDKVIVSSNRVEVYYTIEGEINKYFNKDEKCFWVEYTEDISSAYNHSNTCGRVLLRRRRTRYKRSDFADCRPDA